MKHKLVFIAFVVSLFIPTISYPITKNFIDSENHENRVFAEYPSLENFNVLTFPTEFETAFTDRLPYKNQLMQLQYQKNQLLEVGTTVFEYETASNVITGDGWLFYNALSEGENSLSDYLGAGFYEEEQLQAIAADYRDFQEFMRENYDCEILFFYAPNKEQLYSEYMPKRLQHADYIRTDQLTEYLQANTDVTVIYPKADFLEAKENGHQVYRKYDSHWNRLGAFMASQLIREGITGEGLTLEDVIYEVNEENVAGDLAEMLAMSGTYNDDVDFEIQYEPGVRTEIDAVEDEYTVWTNEGDGVADLTVMMTGDSFSITLAEAMSVDYATFIYAPSVEAIPEMIEKYHPDEFVLETSERSTLRQESWPIALMNLLGGN